MHIHGSSPTPAMRRPGFGSCFLVAIALFLLAGSPAVAEEDHGVSSHGSVGEVSLLLGRAWLQGADNSRRPVRVGSQVHASDQVITEANGHVHIRFVDHALVSVRPNSRLEITDYVFNVERPDQSVVRFRLVEGVTRSISGDAGNAARERFRLDTPIAAIGVRGTDFVVSASPRNVRALVNEGAIVVAPYSEACVAGALGPCLAGGVELAGSSMQIVEVAYGQAEPVLRPRPEQELHELIDSELNELREGEESAIAKHAVSDLYQESVTMRQVALRALATERDRPPLPSAKLPATELAPDTLRQRQLVWGRYASSDQPAAAGISLEYAEARTGRQVAIGSMDLGFGLFRTEPDGARVDAGLGEVGFQLDAAQAFHHGAAGVETMTVRGGDLRINFDQNTFATTLNLDSSATGRFDFSSSGRIFSGGYFHNRSADKNIAGAVSIDGREAGYFFDQQLGSGLIQGITLWGASQ